MISRYQDVLERDGAVDVDDLVLRPFQLLSTDPMVASRMATRWSSINVDEYQDVNDVQAALVALLSPDGGGLCAIGDPDQAIYGFRGAQPGHFSRFSDRYPGTTTVRLRTSYRLTTEIMTTARALVPGSPALRTTAGGPKVEILPCETSASEAEQPAEARTRTTGAGTGQGEVTCLPPQAAGLGRGRQVGGSRSRAMSRAGAEWVMAPTEMKSTPVRATASTRSSVTPPEASRMGRGWHSAAMATA